MQDYYKILKVSRNASEEEIRKSYHILALQFHPDRHGQKESQKYTEIFKTISEAYETLSDVTKRRKYDSINPARLNRPTKHKNKPKSAVQFKEEAFDRRGFAITDAPPPKFDLWGKPIKNEKEEFIDIFKYENDGVPDIRG